MKGDLSTVMFGRKTLDDSTEVVFLLQEDFTRENKYYESHFKLKGSIFQDQSFENLTWGDSLFL